MNTRHILFARTFDMIKSRQACCIITLGILKYIDLCGACLDADACQRHWITSTHIAGVWYSIIPQVTSNEIKLIPVTQTDSNSPQTWTAFIIRSKPQLQTECSEMWQSRMELEAETTSKSSIHASSSISLRSLVGGLGHPLLRRSDIFDVGGTQHSNCCQLHTL